MAEMKTYSSQKFEKRDLIQTIHKMDLINRPYMLICCPEKINEVTAALANIPEKTIMPNLLYSHRALNLLPL